MRRRFAAIAAGAVLLVVAGGLAVARMGGGTLGSFETPAGTAIGGPFQLVDDTGRTVTEADIKGKPTVMYFGYTFCPEVCPTTLFDLSGWIKQLGADADKLNYVFVTVDPERDTVKTMHSYIGSFDPHIRGFTGTPDEVAAMAKAYHVYYQKVPGEKGNYTMDHSAQLFLLGPDNDFVGTIDYQEPDDVALKKLRRLIDKGAAA